jgi:hypothetical protein
MLCICGALLLFVIPVIFVAMPLVCGMYNMAFRQIRGQTITATMMFRGFEVMGPAVLFSLAWLGIGIIPGLFYGTPFIFGMVLNSLVAKIGTGVILCAGIIFHIIIILYFAVRMTFVPMLLIEKRTSFIEAFKISSEVTRDAFWWFLLLNVVYNALQKAGSSVLYIGFLATYPAGLLMYAQTYEDCIGTDKPEEPSEQVIEPGVLV